MEKNNEIKTFSIIEFIEKYYWIFFSVLMAIITFALLFKLGTSPIADWDEARHGVNAYEMLRQKNYIANFYNDSLDYWNLKPPISYWFVILGFKIFGYNAFGLRFFSALAYILVCVIISLYLKKSKGKIQSLLSLIILLSSYYLFINHCFRSGDADSIFLFFYTIAIVSMLKTEDNPNWIFLTGLMFGLCFLTKSWHSITLLPTVFFYLIFTKGFKRLKWWRVCLLFVFALLPIGIWAAIRYNFDGITFFKEMVEYDLLNRSGNAIEGHNGTVFYYLIFMIVGNPAMIVSLIVILLSCIKHRKNKTKMSGFAIGCLVSFLSVFLLFSIVKTKLFWYVAPCVPILAIYTPSAFCNVMKSYKKWVPIVFISLLILCSLVSIVYPFTLKKTSASQNFISSIKNVKSIELYTDYEKKQVDNKDWNQADLLMAELKLDAYCKSGGWEEFIKHENAYIIISSTVAGGIDISGYEIVTQNQDYLFIKHAN